MASKTTDPDGEKGPATSPRSSATGGVENEDDLARGKPQEPCSLVTKAEAQAIIGASIDAPRPQPLGPTCVYQTPDSSTFITMALEKVNFNQIKPLVQDLVAVDGLGRQAYCGSYGRPALFVLLNSNRFLNITARCDIAKQFAAKALPRVQL
jgi:hypothetical protein